MNTPKFVFGIILLIVAVVMFFYIEEIKNVNQGVLFKTTLEDVVKFCNAGWGDAFNITFQCMKAQVLYYSPWISGFFGVLLLATAGPYGGYHGAGGYGSHNAPWRLRPRTKKRVIVMIAVSVVVGVGIFLYANYEITVGDQKIDDMIPPESIKKTIEEFSKNFPVKLEERPK